MTASCPTLETYAHWTAHEGPVLALRPCGDVCASMSAKSLRVQRSGGAASFTVRPEVIRGAPSSELDSSGIGKVGLSACEAGTFLPNVLLGTTDAMLLQYSILDGDLRAETRLDVPSGVGITALAAAPTGTVLAVGCSDGTVQLFDLRASLSHGAVRTVTAHQGQVRHLSFSPHGDFLASTGLFSGAHRSAVDRRVSLFDARRGFIATAPVLHPQGARWAGFSPAFGATLCVASEMGLCMFTDCLQGQVTGVTHVGDPEAAVVGGGITCGAVSSSGQVLAVADGHGIVRLWRSDATNPQPLPDIPGQPPPPSVVNTYSQPTLVAERYTYRGPLLHEQSVLAQTPPYDPSPYLHQALQRAAQGGRAYLPTIPAYLSDEDLLQRTVRVGKPPHAIHETLVTRLRPAPTIAPGAWVSDNPHFVKGQPRGSATARSVPLRHARVTSRHSRPKRSPGNLVGLEPDLAAKCQAAYALVPASVRRVTINETEEGSRAPFAEVDYRPFNKTRLAGLDHEASNTYVNALLQVLFFLPNLARPLLELRPSPKRISCLTDELSFLMHMLARAPAGIPCQAANFLAALRQNREAIGLGLLESRARDTAGLSRNREDGKAHSTLVRHLATRMQILARFLVRQLGEEGVLDARLVEENLAWRFREFVAIVRGAGTLDGASNSSYLDAPESIKCEAERSAKITSHQIELVYPPRESRIQIHGQALPEGVQQVPEALLNPEALPLLRAAHAPNHTWLTPRPCFAHVLAHSLLRAQTMRAWFDEARGYQPVRQWRALLAVPKTLILAAELNVIENLAYWLPVKETEEDGGEEGKAWLPLQIEIAWCDHGEGAEGLAPGMLRVTQWDDDGGGKQSCTVGERRELPVAMTKTTTTMSGSTSKSGLHRVQYELHAIVSHVMDLAPVEDDGEPGSLQNPHREGHLIAQTKVRAEYLAGKKGSPPSPLPPTPGLAPISAEFLKARAEAQTAAAAPAPATAAEVSSVPTSSAMAPILPTAETPGPTPQSTRTGQRLTFSDVSTEATTHLANMSLTRVEGKDRETGQDEREVREEYLAPDAWVTINDVAVTVSSEHEARNVCRGLKVPALVVFTQMFDKTQNKVEENADYPPTPSPPPLPQRMDKGGASPSPLTPKTPSAATSTAGTVVVPIVSKHPTPILTPDEFSLLCSEPSLNASRPQLAPRSFVPLDLTTERPARGFLLAIDTEFVQMAPAETVYREGVQIQLRPPRLALARVSVVRGNEGPRFGTCFMDDHVHLNEPVWDYLTRYSGVQDGDLDPATSQHHLVPLKHAYLKLRYLVDSGCTFVGHGLRKDFKMVNMVVPREQVIDTVDLFHFKHQRKLSLRFLAAVLLDLTDFQEQTHDSIEDARVALLIYKRYVELRREGKLEETVLEMYRKGKEVGWDPRSWKRETM